MLDIYWNILKKHGPIKVKSPNNISKWQMGFNSAFKGLKPGNIRNGTQCVSKRCRKCDRRGTCSDILFSLSFYTVITLFVSWAVKGSANGGHCNYRPIVSAVLVLTTCSSCNYVLYVYWELLRFIAPNFAVSERGVYRRELDVTLIKLVRESVGRTGFLLTKSVLIFTCSWMNILMAAFLYTGILKRNWLFPVV
jgi:hypothetical protein